MIVTPPRACRCGHLQYTHEHYRPGSDCGACGPTACPRFRRDFPTQKVADIGVVSGMVGILALAARTVAGIARRRTW